MTKSILVFAFYTATDYLVVLYYRGVLANSRWSASLISMAITGMGLVGIVIVVDSPWLIAAAVVGAGVGTWWGMGK